MHKRSDSEILASDEMDMILQVNCTIIDHQRELTNI
jgi:hypothetical protein